MRFQVASTNFINHGSPKSVSVGAEVVS